LSKIDRILEELRGIDLDENILYIRIWFLNLSLICVREISSEEVKNRM
jgi:hypothetical protein